MGRFKPVIKVVPAATNTKSSNNNNNKTTPPTPPSNDNNTTPTVVSVSTQKGQKNQKVSDGQIKKAATPRKKKTSKKTAATVEAVRTGKIDSYETNETKPNVAMLTPEGSTTASAPDGVLPASVTKSTKSTKSTRKRKSKDNKNNDNLQIGSVNHEGESKPKRIRKTKDPNAPKKPPNAYLQFTLVKRAELKQQHPGMSPKEITAMLGEAWRKMSDAEKKPYYDLVTQALAQWQEDMKAYQASNNVGIIQEQNMAQTNESVNIYQDNAQLISQSNNLEPQPVSDNGVNNLSEIIVSNSNNTVNGLFQLPANTVNYDSYGEQDSMEDLLDMPEYNSTNTDMNETHLYMNNINTNYSLPSAMIPVQVNNIVDQDAHSSYYTQDFITTHQEHEQNQAVKQDLLLCQPFDPSRFNQKLESNAQETPIIQKQEKPDTNNMLLCQPFEPSNNTGNDNNDNSWLQDGTQYQDQDQHPFNGQQMQQEYSESIMYSHIPQYEQQFISSQEHAPQHPVYQEVIPHQEHQHIEMYQQSLHQLIL